MILLKKNIIYGQSYPIQVVGDIILKSFGEEKKWQEFKSHVKKLIPREFGLLTWNPINQRKTPKVLTQHIPLLAHVLVAFLEKKLYMMWYLI